MYSLSVDFNQILCETDKEIASLSIRNSFILSEINTNPKTSKILNDSVEILRSFVKFYISDKVSSSELPDIHRFLFFFLTENLTMF